MTGEPMHTASEMVPCTLAMYISYCLKSEVSITLRCQLYSFVVSYICSTHYIAFQIKNCSKSTSANPCIPKEMVPHTPATNYHLKTEVSIMLCCWLCIPCYTAVRIKNCSKSTSAIKIATMKNTDDFHYKVKPSCATAKSTLFAVSKDEWDTKEDIGKSMKNALYVLQYVKKHLSGQSNIEQ